MFPGVYTFDAYSIEINGVFTNLTPTDAYRGAGRPEAAYAIERIMDALARELDMDPAEIRRKNFYEPFDEPTTTPAGLQYDSFNLPGRARPGAGARRLRGACARSSSAQARGRTTPSSSASGSRRTPRSAASAPSQVLAGLRHRRRRLGGRRRQDARYGQGRGRHRHLAARPGPRDELVPDRRRRPRALRPTTWRSSTATRPPSPSAATPTARAASPSAA